MQNEKYVFVIFFKESVADNIKKLRIGWDASN